MTIMRAVHAELSRVRVERAVALRLGVAFAAAMGNEKALAFCAKEKIVVRSAAETSNSAGGFLVPPELEDAISVARSLTGTIRRECNVRPMGSDLRSVPRRLSAAVGTFVAENQQAAETGVGFDSVALHAQKAVALLRASTELLEDAAAGLGEFLVGELAAALAELEDSCGWTGDGSAAFGRMTGILTKLLDGSHTASTVTAGAGHDSLAKVDAGDVEALMAKLPENFLSNAKFFAPAAGIAALTRLGAAPYGSTETPYGPRPLMQFGGVPIVPVAKFPGSGSQSGKIVMAYGSMPDAVVFGERRHLVVKTSEQRYLDQDQIAVRVTARFDINAAGLGDNAKPGAMIGLVAA